MVGYPITKLPLASTVIENPEIAKPEFITNFLLESTERAAVLPIKLPLVLVAPVVNVKLYDAS